MNLSQKPPLRKNLWRGKSSFIGFVGWLYQGSLIKALRTSKGEERKSFALKLAKTGTREAVWELIRMSDGGIKQGWHRYNLADQLLGIEALGETRSTTALSHLKKLIQSEISERRYWIMQTYDYGSLTVEEHVYFPNTRGELWKELLYVIHVGGGEEGCQVFLTSEEKEKQHREAKETNQAYQTILSAVQKLEGMLSSVK